ncbi:hypothetical protein AMELA_G00150290 [Ameiurus melas]|uniref:Uncharacterized protein n=1 Tax=Ameiurus melas TaxID=219545 RepID=A0A7J6AJS3_AMEME|nr:hypothetical protein AMELA_G00150290 [Ameiurus melas]
MLVHPETTRSETEENSLYLIREASEGEKVHELRPGVFHYERAITAPNVGRNDDRIEPRKTSELLNHVWIE